MHGKILVMELGNKIEYIEKNRKEGKCYVFLDEIQMIDDWQDVCNIYNELIYMGYNINVFNNNGKEIDFLAIKGNKKYYVQVAYSVAEDKTYKREFDAFANLDNLCQKILITNDYIDYSTCTVKHIKLKDFLIMNSLEDVKE